jgi:hypothetical protein
MNENPFKAPATQPPTSAKANSYRRAGIGLCMFGVFPYVPMAIGPAIKAFRDGGDDFWLMLMASAFNTSVMTSLFLGGRWCFRKSKRLKDALIESPVVPTG